ncbi:MAG: carboxymuconolactone decarboxylase family protein [Actinomycetota bacterium]
MTYGREVLDEIREPAIQLRKLIPDVYQGFSATGKGALTSGALDTKTKELIALALGVSQKCDGCIATHARGAARAGATEEEVAEALGVCILLDGGPGTVYGPRAFAAFKEFEEYFASRK